MVLSDPLLRSLAKRLAAPCVSSTYLLWQYLMELRMAIWHRTNPSERLGNHSVEKPHSSVLSTNGPGRCVVEECAELRGLDERRPQPDASADAPTGKTVTRTEILSSESRQIGVVCILGAPVPFCSRRTMHGKRSRCRSLIGDRRKPTRSCKAPTPPISLGNFFAAMLIIEKIIANCRVMDRSLR